MVFLILNILVSNVMTVVFKLADIKKLNGDRIMLVNYIVAVGISLRNMLAGQFFSVLPAVGQAELNKLFSERTTGNTILIALGLGLFVGCVYMLNLLLTKASIARNGAGLSTFFSKTGFVGGVLISAVLWREIPGVLQWVAVALILVALVLISGDLRKLSAQAPFLLPFLLLGGAVVELSNKVFTVYAFPEYKPIYLFTIFSVALLMCAMYNVHLVVQSGNGFALTGRELGFGIILGTANAFGTQLMLKALERLPTSVVFPSQAAGGLMLIMVISWLLFREPSSKKQIAAVGLAVVSLILINL